MYEFILAIADEERRNLVGEICSLYYDRMIASARKILKNDQDAKDAVQDAFLKLVTNNDWVVKDLTAKTTVALISIVCRNSAYNIYNKNRHRNKIFSSLEEMCEEGFEPFSDVDESLAELINKENREFMSKVIDKLDRKYRDVVLLRYNYNMPYENIGSIVNATSEVVKGRLFRAKKNLRKLILTEKKIEEKRCHG